MNNPEGILLIDKPKGTTSFSLVAALRKSLNVKTIGHAGTLDPLATGLMVLLVGRPFTRLSNRFLEAGKEYIATIKLGAATDTYDAEGQTLLISSLIPTQQELEAALKTFQGEILQTPPMFSAKKVQGKKLYELARQGKTVEREPVKVTLDITFEEYAYPFVHLKISCSKGTYIRSLAHDLGSLLGCGGHLFELRRTRSGSFDLENCIDGDKLLKQELEKEFICQNLICRFTEKSQETVLQP